ncbi:MAG: hypothetical protein JXB32_17940 [Deltaproteobacteria bacterium]|nr:hypothetical protein [Deltaproteobacteria bacterium]
MRFGTADRAKATQQAFAEFIALRGLSDLGQIQTAMVPVKAGGEDPGDNGGDNDGGGNGNGGSSGSRRCPPCRGTNGWFIIGTVSCLSLLTAAIFGR